MIMKEWEPALTKEECNNRELGTCYCGECERGYGYTKGLGDTISCDDCNEIAENWFTGEGRAICGNCYGVIV
jgi:hypothetical protein